MTWEYNDSYVIQANLFAVSTCMDTREVSSRVTQRLFCVNNIRI